MQQKVESKMSLKLYTHASKPTYPKNNKKQN